MAPAYTIVFEGLWAGQSETKISERRNHKRTIRTNGEGSGATLMQITELEEGWLEKELIRRQIGGLSYRPCFICQRHPRYPNIPPITLHRGNRCMICNSLSKTENDLEESQSTKRIKCKSH
jgi:hypothetical protein